MGTIIAIIILVMAALIIYLLISKKTKPAQKQTPHIAPPDIEQPEIVLSPLVDIRLKVQLEGLPAEVIDHYDKILDQLMELMPIVMSDYPKEELTYVLKFIAGKHLPGIMQRYLALPPGERSEQSVINDTLSALDILESEIHATAQVVKEQRSSEFDSQVRLLKARFGGAHIDAQP